MSKPPAPEGHHIIRNISPLKTDHLFIQRSLPIGNKYQMKNFLIALAMLFPLATSAPAQIPFPQSWAVMSVHRNPSGFCPQGTTFADGCSGAVAAELPYPTEFSSYAVRPPWNVAGVDYPAGLPVGLTLLDPTTAALPTGCVFTSASHKVTCSTAGVTISGYDFSLHNGTQFVCAANNLTLKNSQVTVGTNQGSLGEIIVATAACSNFTMTNNDVNGNSIAVTAQQGVTVDFINNGGGTFTSKYNRYHLSGGDMIDFGSSHSIVTNFLYNIFDEIGVNTAHSDAIQFCSQVVGSGSEWAFNNVYTSVPTGNGNGIFVTLSECPGMTMASLDISNNVVISTAGCGASGCNWLIGFYDDDSATSQNVSIRHTYGDPTGVDMFTGSPWFGTGATGADLAHPSLLYGLTNMVTNAIIPVPSQSAPQGDGYYVYPDTTGYVPALNDIFSISASPATGTVSAGSVITFTVNLAVVPWTVSGTPTLTLSSGGHATYASGSGSNTLVFSYTVGSSDSATNLQITAINP